MATKKLYEVNANEEVSRPADFALNASGAPTETYVQSLFSSDNTSLVDTIEAKGTAPDAHLEVDGKGLKLINASNVTVYDSRYADTAATATTEGSSTAYTLADKTINTLTLSASATVITLPTAATTDTTVKDCVLDVTNGYTVDGTATAATISFAQWTAETVSIMVGSGESLSTMTSLAASEHALFSFAQIGNVNSKPTWLVSKKVIVAATAS